MANDAAPRAAFSLRRLAGPKGLGHRGASGWPYAAPRPLRPGSAGPATPPATATGRCLSRCTSPFPRSPRRPWRAAVSLRGGAEGTRSTVACALSQAARFATCLFQTAQPPAVSSPFGPADSFSATYGFGGPVLSLPGRPRRHRRTGRSEVRPPLESHVTSRCPGFQLTEPGIRSVMQSHRAPSTTKSCDVIRV